jgi:hypothetical protein
MGFGSLLFPGTGGKTPACKVRRHLFDLAQETQLAHTAKPDPFFDR